MKTVAIFLVWVVGCQSETPDAFSSEKVPAVALASTSGIPASRIVETQENPKTAQDDVFPPMMPAVASSPSSDCRGVINGNNINYRHIRSGQAAIGTKTGQEFVPMLYFWNVAEAKACSRGNPDLSVGVWTGNEWRISS